MDVLANRFGLFDQSMSIEIFHQDTHELLWNNVEGLHFVENKSHVNFSYKIVNVVT